MKEKKIVSVRNARNLRNSLQKQSSVVDLPTSVMDIKCILCVIIYLFYIESQEIDNSEEDLKCYDIYECCNKIDFDCVDYCEPFHICTTNGTDHISRYQEIRGKEQNLEEVESTTVQTPDGQKIISVAVCRKGFRLDGAGKCRKAFWGCAISDSDSVGQSSKGYLTNLNYSKMRHICAELLLMLSLLCVAVSSSENCVWTYKCCLFKEINGETKCIQICEPEVNCTTPDPSDSEVETFTDSDVGDASLSPLISGCRRGYKYYSGRCRRVFGKANDLV